MPRVAEDGAGPAVSSNEASAAREKRLFHRFKRVRQGLVAARKAEMLKSGRQIKRLEAKTAASGQLSDSARAQLEKLRVRVAWLRELDGSDLMRLCGFVIDITKQDVGSSVTPQFAAELDPRQRGALQKLLDSKTVRERLDELRDELVPGDKSEKRKKKNKDMDDEMETTDDVEAEAETDEPNPYAHWATADYGDNDDDDGDNIGHGAVGRAGQSYGDDEDDGEEDENLEDGALAWDDEVDADGAVPFEVEEPEEDGSGMFLSSLSATASLGRAPPRVSRDVFAAVDTRAAASTQIGGKKRKNRPGQMARQKKAAMIHGEEAKHVRDPTKDAIARQEERRKKKFKKDKDKGAKGRDKPNRASRRAESEPIKPANPNQHAAEESVHPSWAAKKQANSATIVPFEGKRITFD